MSRCHTRTRSGDRRPRSLIAAVLSIALVAASCTSNHSKSATSVSVKTTTPRAPKGSWVGTVAGTNALVAVESDGLEVTAYVCDSAKIASWFRGPASGGTPHLVSDDGATFDATLTKGRSTGTVTEPNGHRLSFAAPATTKPALFRSDETVNGKRALGGWIIGTNGEQRGAVTFGGLTTPAPNLTAAQIGQTTFSIAIPDLFAVQASVVAPANVSPPTPNTTGFSQFVVVGLGDSFGAGNGNPAKPATNISLTTNLLPWAKLAAACAVGGPIAAAAAAPIFGAGGVLLAQGLASVCAFLAGGGAVGALAAGETSIPAVSGLTDIPNSNEQWGAIDSTNAQTVIGSIAVPRDPSPPADEPYRLMCHRGISASEKAVNRLRADPKYARVQFVYYNFSCSGTKIRHIISQPYDGDSERNNSGFLSALGISSVTNAIPPQLDQLRALLGDQGTFGPNTPARTFIDKLHVSSTVSAPVQIPHVDAAYISTGGNDAGFGPVVQACMILPFPDCPGVGTPDIHKGDSPDTNSDNDENYSGLDSVAGSYSKLADSLNSLVVQRGPNPLSPTTNMKQFPITPAHVYLGEYPDPIIKNPTTGTLCDSTTPPLQNDTLGLGTQQDAAFAEQFLDKLDGKVDDATVAHAAPGGPNGLGGWTVVKNRNATLGRGICMPSTTRAFNTGGDALKLTGNDLSPAHALLDVSASIVHPNNFGYEAVADKVEGQLRQQLDAEVAAPPAQPTGLREVGATQGGEIDIRWDDKANNENSYQVLSRPAGSNDDFTVLTQLPADTQDYRDTRSGSRTHEYKIRACTFFSVCTDSDVVLATNQPPVPPTGLKAGFTPNPINPSLPPVSIDINWVPELKNTIVLVQAHAQVGSTASDQTYSVEQHSNPTNTRSASGRPVDPPSVLHLTTAVGAPPGTPLPNTGTYTFRVRGCNVLGCTALSDPVTTTGGTPTISTPPTIAGPTTSFTTIKPSP